MQQAQCLQVTTSNTPRLCQIAKERHFSYFLSMRHTIPVSRVASDTLPAKVIFPMLSFCSVSIKNPEAAFFLLYLAQALRPDHSVLFMKVFIMQWMLRIRLAISGPTHLSVPCKLPNFA
jgi:hypothetical protein